MVRFLMRFPGMLTLIAALTPSQAWAYGEPGTFGAPNQQERLLHVLTNQVRQAPHDWPDWDTSLATPEPRTPLGHQMGLVEAARFHADDMAANAWFAHESSDGTTFGERVSRYFRGPSGENIYTAFGDDRARSAIVGWMNSDGHRVNMLRNEWNWLGTGYAQGASQIYYVQDFGTSTGSVPPIPAGAFEATATSLKLIANYWDPAARAPQSFKAFVDGRGFEMSSIAGQDGNQTLEIEVELPTDCVKIYFEAIDADAMKTLYPSDGALLAGPGCSSDYTTDRPAMMQGPMGPVIVDADDRPQGGCVCAPRPTRLGHTDNNGSNGRNDGTGGRDWTALLAMLSLLILPTFFRRVLSLD